MALTYRNTLKGHVVSVPEPVDIISAAEAEAERLMRVGTKQARIDADRLANKAQSAARHQKQTLAKMDASRRWERYTAPPAAAVVPPQPPDPVTVAVAMEPAPAKKVAAKAIRAEAEAEA